MAYTYDPIFAADPNNPAVVAANAAILIYDPADTGKAPIAITDSSGSPLANPITVNKNGFGPAFQHPTIDRVAWQGGGFEGFFTSYEGMKNAALDAATAANASAGEAATAAANASAAATASLASAVADAEAAQAAATAAANLVGAPADSAVQTLINAGGSATRAALNATYATPAAVTAATVNKALIADQAQLADQAIGIARVAQVFARPAGGISVSRVGSDYWLWHGLGGGLFARHQLQNQTGNAGSLPLRQLSGLDTVRAMIDTDDTGIPTTGTWTSGTNALSVGGGYRYSTTAGDTMTYTSPAGATSVGVSVVEITNGGMLMKVEIDASATAADKLDTAQDVVTRGWYANTILVANGGTLNPTDRVMDSYSPTTGQNNYAARRVAAADLTAGAHVVKITNTGYNRIGLSSQRAYVTGFLHALPATVLTDSGAAVVTDTVLNAVASAWEYAYYGQPAGTTAPGEMGNIHGWEAEISLTITVDGTVSTPADGARVDGTREIVVTRVSQLRHTQLGTTPVADVVTTYRLDRRGLRVDVQTTWNLAIDLTWAWLMLPVNGPTTNAIGQKFNRAALMDYPGGAYTLTGGNGDYYTGRSKSVAGWVWSTTGKFAVMAAVPDHTTFLNRWAKSGPAYAQINDRSGNINKLYFARVSTTPVDTIAAGTVVTSSVRYKVGYFPAGAEASLASL